MNKFDIDLNKLFDVQNVEDLPEFCKKNIFFGKPVSSIITLSDMVYDLFSIKSSLTVNEIVAGLYRKFRVEKSRKKLYTILSKLTIKKTLRKRIEDGVKVFDWVGKTKPLLILNGDEIFSNGIQKEKKEQNKNPPKKMIPLQEWNRYHKIPKMCTLRYYVAHREKNGFDQCVLHSSTGRKLLIDEEKFFKWASENNKKFLKEV